MQRRRDDEEHGEGGSERWLLTYSDMITLLLALFAVLYAISSVDAKKFKQVSEGLESAFHTKPTATASAPKSASTGAGNMNVDNTYVIKNADNSHTPKLAVVSELDKIEKDLTSYIKQHKLQNDINLETTDSYIRIHIKNALMFYPDSSKMIESSLPILKEIKNALNNIYNEIDHITISGNTADTGYRDHQSRAFAWRLSTERSVTVLNCLTQFGLKEDKLSIEGNSRYSPIASNNTEAGMAQNRRVDITIYKDWANGQPKPAENKK